MQLAYAAENTKDETKYEKVLLDIGYPQATIDQLSSKEKQENVETYLKNPDKTSVTSTVFEVDVLSEIDLYVNSTYEQKIKAGASDEKIKEADKELEVFSDMSDEELKAKYDFDDVKVRLLRDALEPDESYKFKKNNDVTASGSITTSEMTLTLVSTDYSQSTYTKYGNSIYFNWSSWYFFGIFNDKLPIAWGGNLLMVPLNQTVGYYNQPQNSWGSFGFNQSVAYVETTINAGGYFEFPQAISGCKAKTGNFAFYLQQNGRYNTQSKILAQFAHQIITIGSADITVDSSPSITIGSAYDTSVQRYTNITY